MNLAYRYGMENIMHICCKDCPCHIENMGELYDAMEAAGVECSLEHVPTDGKCEFAGGSFLRNMKEL
jgi:hypothetical protein